MANESADKVEASSGDKKKAEASKDDAADKVEDSKGKETKENDGKPEDGASKSAHPLVKLNNKENDAEMIKPAEVSDSENIEDSEAPKEKSKEEAQAPKEGEAANDSDAKDKKMEDEQELVEEVPP